MIDQRIFINKIISSLQYLRQNSTLSVIPCRVSAPGAWNLPAVATASACCGVCAHTRRFPDRSQGMTGKRGATPHPLPTLCTIGARKITTAVTVAPTHTGDLKLLPTSRFLLRLKPTHSEMDCVSRGGTETRSCAVSSIFNSANTYAKTPAHHSFHAENNDCGCCCAKTHG